MKSSLINFQSLNAFSILAEMGDHDSALLRRLLLPRWHVSNARSLVWVLLVGGFGLPAHGQSAGINSSTPVSEAGSVRTEVRVVEQSLAATDRVDEVPEGYPDTPAAAQGRVITQLPFEAPKEDNAAEPMSGMEREYQMQLLQQEVQMLRGMVEELQHQLQRLKQTQDDRYLELDGRVQMLSRAESTLPAPVGSLPSQQRTVSVAPAESAGSTVPSEKALYDTARELIGNRQYDLAISQLQAVIDSYPDGDYAANAYYWLGEVYLVLATPNYQKARQAFAQVISFFPDHRKVPDAAFKLGITYHLMGDCDQARNRLEGVVAQYQGRAVAKLASNYLRDKMQDCGAQ